MFFFSVDLNWEGTQKIVEVIRYFSALLKHCPQSLGRKHWDFGVISLVAWTENILKVKARFDNVCVSIFVVK